MQSQKEFSLPIKGLKTGFHHFEFQIGNLFFREFPESTIKNGEFSVKVDLERRPDLLIFEFKIDGFFKTLQFHAFTNRKDKNDVFSSNKRLHP